ncbi:OadG family protein [Senegalia massiliensis]|uniref:Sodium pump decarboxylase subunit gamma n=1 Tax=Senegalia massiliensis TaxID=1720316 RepID=A0A845QX09_9CLOT|nr:OadG family protein [Senegalia massiliensis]NBI06524.1 sodium pump decarboxylase subunit gamma [Senegalia massiliensis]
MNLQDGISLSEGLIVTVFSMAIVFATLVVISLILTGFKSAFYKEEKKEPVKKGVLPVNENTVVENTEEIVDNDEELVSVIAAAISAATGQSVENIYIRNIKRVSQASPVWAMAGRQEGIYNNLKGH